MLTVDPASVVPPYEQLRSQLLRQIRTGDLAPGTRLPPVRRLAGDLALAPGTVARAYRELEAAGVLQTRGRHGTFVNTHGDAGRREAQAAAHSYAERVRALDIDVDEALALVAAALRGA